MMASSKVMPTTTSTANTDLPRQPSICSSLSTLLADLQNHPHQQQHQPIGDPSQTLGSMTMDDLLKNIYSSPPPDNHAPPFAGASISREGSFFLSKDVGNKSVDDVWKEIVAGGDQRRPAEGDDLEGMTLEDFLTKAGAVREEDVRGVGASVGVTVAVGDGVQAGVVPASYGVDAAVNGQFPAAVGFVNGGVDQRVAGRGAGGAGRGKRRAVEEPPVDKATQQKQRRMIKNRESAARSRERKQAYTVELESLVTQLEEENARLLREEAEQRKERFMELMTQLVPVTEGKKKLEPKPQVLRRVHSWLF